MSDKMFVVAGKSVGEGADKIVLKRGDGSISPVLVKGHWLYVRKCKRPKELGGITIPEKTRKETVFATILAIGTDVNKPLSKKERRKYKVGGSGRMFSANIYDRILGPDDHPFGITRSPWGVDEFFIHQECVKAVMENEDV